MGDRCWGRIEIGGCITEKQAEDLSKDLGLTFRYPGIPLRGGNLFRMQLHDVQPHEDTLVLEDDEVNYGEFEVEEHLTTWGIPYRKTISSGDSYPAGTCLFDGTVYMDIAEIDGEPVFNVNTIKSQHKAGTLNIAAMLDEVKRIYHFKLPPLKIGLRYLYDA